MSTTTTTRSEPGREVERPDYRFDADQYLVMVRDGLFRDDRVELLEGRIVTKMTKYRPHTICVCQTADALRAVLPAGWHLEQESPLDASPSSVPEPDIMIVRGVAGDYRDRLPAGPDVALAVEIADSSWKDDRRKAAIYARAGVAAYWIVNLVDRVVEAHDGPSGPGDAPAYARREVVAEGGSVPLLIEGREVARLDVRGLLP